MDKNTLTGLVLIGAIMFGFFYLTKPKETPREGQESAVATSAGVAQNAQAVAGIDSHLLAQTVRTLGSMSPDSSFHYTSPQMSHGFAAGTAWRICGMPERYRFCCRCGGRTQRRGGHDSQELRR